MSQSRQLAAIMFTDIVGYTSLMGEDEKKAFELLKKNRNLQRPIIEEYNGRWIKELGDGVLASFNTVSDAVNAAIKIQEACNISKEFLLRIGIHQGEVVFEHDDIFGDAVNIASRIQAIAIPGGIYVSESVHNNISNKQGIETVFVKTESLKNVKAPVRIYQINSNTLTSPAIQVRPHANRIHKKSNRNKFVLIPLGLVSILILSYFLFRNFQKTGANDKLSIDQGSIEKSIAVLPFENLSNDKEQEYFSDGLSDELLNLLTKVPDLKVINRASSFSFKGNNEDLKTIGEKLGVANLLQGSVRKDGNKIRVSAKLVRAADGLHLWSDNFTRDLEGILKLQDDIAGAVVNQLKLKLFKTRINSDSLSTNTEVHNLILQGNFFAEKRDSGNLEKALNFYKKALTIDSMNARCWAAIAKCYSIQSTWELIDRNQGYENARKAATKAIELDDSQPEGHYALGAVKMYDFDWDGAEREFDKSLELDPGKADYLRILGFLYECQGRFDDAIRLTKKAITLDPILAISHFTLGQHLFFALRQEEAIESCNKALDLNPFLPRVHTFLSMIYLTKLNPQIALAQLPKETNEAWRSFGLVLCHHALGHKSEADKLLNDYIFKFKKSKMFLIAVIYAFRGEKDKSFEWLEKAFLVRDPVLTYLKGNPLLKNLEGDQRYTAFLKKMNLSID